MTRLVVIGSVIVDQLMRVPRLPDRGGDVLADPVTAQPGGAFNILAAASRLGLDTALAGRIGTGPSGSLLSQALHALGTQQLLPPAAEGDSGTCIGFVEPDGERTFVTSPGVEQHLADIDFANISWRADDYLYVSGYDLLYPQTGPAVARLLERYQPAQLLLDPGPLLADIPGQILDAVLAATTVLSLNERELGILGEIPQGPLRSWARLPSRAVVVARVGASGAWLHLRDQAPTLIASRPVAAVDTTGAGDAHAGALLAALADGLDLPTAVSRANAAAALAVTRHGSATGPSREELAAFLS